MTGLDRTHDPKRRSWIETANARACDFPIQNLPYGVFSVGDEPPRAGIAIGDQILDLAALEAAGLVRPDPSAHVFDRPDLNAFMALPQSVWTETRAAIGDLLDQDNSRLRNDRELRSRALMPMKEARQHLPIFVRGFTDFYASREHAMNVGAMFRGADNALMPNWLHMPVGYNGRASTIVVSGTPIRRPWGQIKRPDGERPAFEPTRKLDCELELGAIIGTPCAMGDPVTTADAYDMIFGYMLLNDWSARDIQVWEYQPLGPFLSKAFATTISPWVVTREALEPFRCPTPERIEPLLPYLAETTPNNFDIELEIELAPKDQESTLVSHTNARHLYYSSAQQLAHHTASGCAMQTGDLLGSGTISGPTPASTGSLLERTINGREPITVGDGRRTFIEDHDTLRLRGWCDAEDFHVGFGICEGRILPAHPPHGR